jgi:hypothetical protein
MGSGQSVKSTLNELKELRAKVLREIGEAKLLFSSSGSELSTSLAALKTLEELIKRAESSTA